MRDVYGARSNGHAYPQRGWEERNEPRRSESGWSHGAEHMRGRDQDSPYVSVRSRDRSEGRRADVVKVIEVLAESEHSWEDAARTALTEASRTIRNIRSIYVQDMQAVVRGDEIVAWRLNAKISFALENDREPSRDARY